MSVATSARNAGTSAPIAYDSGYYRDANGRLYRNGDDSNTNGTLIGALIGGALGNQVGNGDGRRPRRSAVP